MSAQDRFEAYRESKTGRNRGACVRCGAEASARVQVTLQERRRDEKKGGRVIYPAIGSHSKAFCADCAITIFEAARDFA